MGAPARSAARGFTLTELLVSTAVMALVALGALALLTSEQRAFQNSAGDRGLQETARTALTELGTNLRRAGYGIEPWLAIDFGPANGPFGNFAYPSGAPSAYPPSTTACTGSAAVACRDSLTGPDELVFYARDPAFSRKLASAPSSSSLTLATALTGPLYKGQILQVMCGGASAWAYVTVGAVANAGATAVTLDSSSSGSFPFQQSQLASGCFNSGYANALVFKVDRFHYYVARYAETGTPAGRPYLMLDRGLWNGSTALVEPVAPDVEDLQVAYVFPRSATQVVGVTAGAQLSKSTGSASPNTAIDLTATPPSYDDITTAASRATNHPANIRAVRVSLVVRTASQDPNLKSDPTSSQLPALSNRAASSSADPQYRRLVVETTEAVRNLDSRGPFYPSYSTNNGADGLNVGGG